MKAQIDKPSLTIAFERLIEASREDVFDAWTKPEQVSEWWDPNGDRLAACEIDLRVGGTFRFVNHAHGPGFSGTYTEIQRPSHLAFDAFGAFGKVLLDSVDGQTRMRVTIRCVSSEQLEQFVQSGVADGTDRTLDNLVRKFAR